MRTLQRLLLFLALVSFQGLALSHSFEHPALKADHPCALCTHVPGLDTGALAPTLADIDRLRSFDSPVARVFHSISGSAHRRYQSRAPPFLVAA